VLATSGGPVAASAMNALVYFGSQRPWLRPRLASMEVGTAGELMRVGLLFFVLGVAMAVAYQSDAIVVAQVLGAGAVTDYAVPMRLFIFIPLLTGIICAPLWAAYGEAAARGDVYWIRQTLRRSLVVVGIIALIGALILTVLGPRLIGYWADDAVRPSLLMVSSLAVWAVLMSVSSALAMALNGLGGSVLRMQAAGAVAMMLANIGLSIWLTRVLGVPGVVLGTVIAQAGCFLLPAWFYTPRALARLERYSSARMVGSSSTRSSPSAGPLV